MRPRTAFPLVTTRALKFLTRNQSAALLMLACGSIVATSAPSASEWFQRSQLHLLSCLLPSVILQDERAPFPIDWQRRSGAGTSTSLNGRFMEYRRGEN